MRSASYNNGHVSENKHAYVKVGDEKTYLNSANQVVEKTIDDPYKQVGLVNPRAGSGASNLRLDIELTLAYVASS